MGKRKNIAPSGNALENTLRSFTRPDKTHSRRYTPGSLRNRLPLLLALYSPAHSVLYFSSYLSHAHPTCVQFNRTRVPLHAEIRRAPLNSFGTGSITVSPRRRLRVPRSYLCIARRVIRVHERACARGTRNDRGAEKNTATKRLKGAWWKEDRQRSVTQQTPYRGQLDPWLGCVHLLRNACRHT